MLKSSSKGHGLKLTKDEERCISYIYTMGAENSKGDCNFHCEYKMLCQVTEAGE